MQSGDYISGEGLSDLEDEMRNIVVFMDSEYSINFDEAVRHSKWKTTMKVEIAAIKRNQT